MIAAKHYKYNYHPLISPKIFFEKMVQSNNESGPCIEENTFQNNFYISIRNEIITLLKKINTSIENNSSTYYMSLLYIDKIFTSQDFDEYIKECSKYKYQINSEIKKMYIVLSVSSLIVSTKFNENDPHFPGADAFLKLCNKFTNYSYSIRTNDLVEGEIVILKLMKYKLNYYSVYNFLVFFFGHGVILDKTLEKIRNNYDKRKMLEKIYILSREILDLINNESNNEYIHLLNKKNNFITASAILSYSIEIILKIKLDENNNENDIFLRYYGIRIDKKTKDNLIDIIKIIHNNKMKNKIKNNVENNNLNNSNKNNILNTFRYTYSSVLLNNPKNQFNNFSLYSSINDNNYNNENNKSNNYIINTSNYGNPNSNYIYNFPKSTNTSNINITDINSTKNKTNSSTTNYDNVANYPSHISYNNNRVYLNYDKNEETKYDLNRNRIFSNELRKSFSMNQLQNKIFTTENNSGYPPVDKSNDNAKSGNNIYNDNKKSNSYYSNKDILDINDKKGLNKIDTFKKNIYILDKDINNSNNYLFEDLYNNHSITNKNKFISLKKYISFNKSNMNNQKDKNPIDDKLNKNDINIKSELESKANYYYDTKYKPNSKYYLKNILSTPSEPLTTTNLQRNSQIQKVINFNNYNMNLNNIENQNLNRSKSKDRKSLYDVIEKTKKIFNMHRETNLIKSNSNNYLDNINLYENLGKDNGMNINKEKNNKNKNTIIINNNININNILDKKKYNNYFNQNNKNQSLINNNFKLNPNKLNTKIYFDNIKNPNKKIYFSYNNLNNLSNMNGNVDKYNNGINVENNKTNRQIMNMNYNMLKSDNKYINTYYDYANYLNKNNIGNINNDIFASHRRFSYYKQNNGYYNLK